MTRSQTTRVTQQAPITVEDLSIEAMEELYLPLHVQNYIWQCRREIVADYQ